MLLRLQYACMDFVAIADPRRSFAFAGQTARNREARRGRATNWPASWSERFRAVKKPSIAGRLGGRRACAALPSPRPSHGYFAAALFFAASSFARAVTYARTASISV